MKIENQNNAETEHPVRDSGAWDTARRTAHSLIQSSAGTPRDFWGEQSRALFQQRVF